MAFCDFNLTELLRGRTALAFSSVRGSLHSSLWQSKDNNSFNSFDFWRISFHFIQDGVILSKIQIQVRMWLVHPQKDRGCFRYKFERDINNHSYSCQLRLLSPVKKSLTESWSNQKSNLNTRGSFQVFYLQLQENPCLLTLCDDFCFTETTDRPRRQFYWGIPCCI